MQRSYSSIASSVAPERRRAQRLLEHEVGEAREALETLRGARERVMRAAADAQGLHETAQERWRELVAVAVASRLDQAPGAFELDERGRAITGGGVLAAEVEVQERRRVAFGLLQTQQLDVASCLAATVAHGAQVAVVLDAHARHLDALRQIPGQPVGDLLVQASLEAVLGPVAEDAQRFVGDRGAVLQIARVVGLRHVERLAPGVPGHGAQQRRVLAYEHLVGVQVHEPVPVRRVEGHVARLGEGPRPLALDDARAEGARDLDRRVGRARVHDHDLVDRPGDRGQAARQHLLLVAHDHAQAQPQALGRLGARRDLDGPAGELGQRGAQRSPAGGAAQQPAAHGERFQLALHALELWIQAPGGLEHRLGRIHAPQLIQDRAGVAEQLRLAGLALEQPQGARGEHHEQRRQARGGGVGARLEPPLEQVHARPVATVGVVDRLDPLEQPAIAVEVLSG